MLLRQVIGYAPSLVIPGLAAFGAIFCYTRLLSPADFGSFSLALSTMAVLNSVFFSWTQMALPRLAPQAIRAGRMSELRATAQLLFAGISLLMVAGSALISGCVPIGHIKPLLALAVPLSLTRSLLNMNQAFHRSALDIRSYNIIECGQAILGLIAGIALVYFLNLGNLGAVIGMIFGMAAVALVDLKTMLETAFKHASGRAVREIAQLSLPMVATMGFTLIISTADRYFIDYFHGVDQLGYYAAGYTLMDRINQILFNLVGMPSYPLLVHRLENEGVDGARAQTYTNGIVMLALVLPACTGLILTARQLDAVFIGSALRGGAIQVMPWIAAASVFNGITSHYFDIAFHLAKKPQLLWFTRGPAAAFSLCANLLLIPRFGYIGAAWSVFGSYLLLLVLTIVFSRRVFPLHFPFRPALKIAASTALMAGVLAPIPFPETLLGLIAMVVLGAATYGAGLVAFDVLNLRTRLMALVGH
ncbi:MAG: oligosaccharide flippase family protein [Alphaproteobacteria bacterium]